MREKNNNILVDLHLKATRITTFIDMLLDINNTDELTKELINPLNYGEIQDNIINVLNILSPIYLDYIKEKGATDGKQES